MFIPEILPATVELANGVTVIVVEEHSAPVASVQAWCQTGSIHEGEWAGAGLTHLLEHELFNGTQRRSSKQISDEIHAAGGYMNAYTSFERTVFWIDCPSKAVATSIDVLGDMLFFSVLEEEALEREMDVIRREFDLGFDDPDRTLSQAMFAAAFQVHPCRYPVIGEKDIFNRLKRADVLEYYERRYVPNNIFLVVAGAVEFERVQEAAESCFGKAPRRALAPLPLPEEPRQLARKQVSKPFPVELSYFNCAWHIPEVSHPDVPALDVVSVILGSGTSSRLNQELREKEGLVYGVGAYAYTPSFPGLFTVSGTCPEKVVQSLPNRILTLVRESFSEHDLEKARRIVTVNSIEQMQTSRGLAADVGISWLYARNANFNRHYLQQIQSLTRDDLNRVAEKYLTDQNLTVATLVPKTKMVPRTNRARPKVEPVLHSFENGAKLVTIPDDRLPLVHASLAVRGGCYSENRQTNGLNRLLAQSITKGTRSRTCEQIADEIERLGGALVSDSGYNSIRISVNSLSGDFEKAFDLLMDVALEPVFPEHATERERETQIATIQAEKAQPHLLARNLLRAAIFRNHPYGLNPNGSEETVRKLTVQELARQRQICFVRPNLVLGVAGDFALEKIVNLAEQALANFSLETGTAWPELPEVQLSESRVITSEEKVHQGIVHVGYLACTMFDADRTSLEVFDEITGDSSSRFFQRIREQLGLAYSVGSSLFMGFSPGIFSVQAATAPEKVELVTEIIGEELMSLASEGLSQEEFERGKARMLAQEAFQQQSLDSNVIGAALNELYGLGYNYAHERYTRIEQLTLETLNEVVRKYLMDKPSITVIIKP